MGTMGSRSEPVTPPTADHVITMCNGGVKAICNGTATVVKDAIREPTEPVSVDFGFTEESTILPTILPAANDVGPVCPQLIITDADGVVTDQWEDLIEVASSHDDLDQWDLPTVVDISTGMNIYLYFYSTMPRPLEPVDRVTNVAVSSCVFPGNYYRPPPVFQFCSHPVYVPGRNTEFLPQSELALRYSRFKQVMTDC